MIKGLINYKSFHHEGHEVNEGERQSDLLNKVVVCANLVIKYSNKQVKVIQQYLQFFQSLHGELFIQPIILLTHYVNSWIPGEYNA